MWLVDVVMFSHEGANRLESETTHNMRTGRNILFRAVTWRHLIRSLPSPTATCLSTEKTGQVKVPPSLGGRPVQGSCHLALPNHVHGYFSLRVRRKRYISSFISRIWQLLNFGNVLHHLRPNFQYTYARNCLQSNLRSSPQISLARRFTAWHPPHSSSWLIIRPQHPSLCGSGSRRQVCRRII